MAGNRKGGLKAHQIIIETRGHEFIEERGRRGGQVKTKKGFAVSGKASEAGKKGRASQLNK